MYKKAQIGEQIYLIPYLIAFVLIGGGVIFGSVVFFGEEYDFRKVDASLLNQHISSCLSQNTFDPLLLEENLFSLCNLNENVTREHFLIKITQDSEVLFNWRGDNTKCALSDKNPAFPKCITKNVTLKNIKYTILTGSNQHRLKKTT